MRDGFQSKTTRDAILDAAAGLLAKNGYKKMTIDDLAREVGIGKGSVYLHFTSKEEIALSHIDRLVERVKERLRSIAEGGAPLEKRLHDMLVERVMIRFDNVQFYSQSLNEILGYLRPQLLERRKRYFGEESRILSVIIADAQTDGIFAPGDPLDLAQTLIVATNSLLPYSLSAIELGKRDDVADRTQKTATLLIKGLRLV